MIIHVLILTITILIRLLYLDTQFIDSGSEEDLFSTLVDKRLTCYYYFKDKKYLNTIKLYI